MKLLLCYFAATLAMRRSWNAATDFTAPSLRVRLAGATSQSASPHLARPRGLIAAATCPRTAGHGDAMLIGAAGAVGLARDPEGD
jgi:hypothetical protein